MGSSTDHYIGTYPIFHIKVDSELKYTKYLTWCKVRTVYFILNGSTWFSAQIQHVPDFRHKFSTVTWSVLDFESRFRGHSGGSAVKWRRSGRGKGFRLKKWNGSNCKARLIVGFVLRVLLNWSYYLREHVRSREIWIHTFCSEDCSFSCDL